MRLRTRVHLDGQKGKPTADEALRVVGNLVTPNGKLAPPDLVKTVGIGTRVRMVFSDAAFGLGVRRCGEGSTAIERCLPDNFRFLVCAPQDRSPAPAQSGFGQPHRRAGSSRDHSF